MGKEQPMWYQDPDMSNAIAALGEVVPKEQVVFFIPVHPSDKVLVIQNGEPLDNPDIVDILGSKQRRLHASIAVRMAIDDLVVAMATFNRSVQSFDCVWGLYPVPAHAEGEAYLNDRLFPQDMTIDEIVAMAIRKRG